MSAGEKPESRDLKAEEATLIMRELAEIKQAVAFRPAYIKGYAGLSRYLGCEDPKGRVGKRFSESVGLNPTMINGVPYFDIRAVDRAMKPGRVIETRKVG